AAGLYPPDVVVEIDQSAAVMSGGAGGPGSPVARTGDDVVSAALVDLHRSSHVTGLISTASHKPVIAPLVTSARRAIRSSLTWYMNGILEQVNRFAERTVRSVSLLSERTSQLDARVASLEEKAGELAAWRTATDEEQLSARLTRLDRAVADMRDRLDAATKAGTGSAAAPAGGAFGVNSRDVERGFDYLAFENKFRGDPQAIADRQRFYLDLFRGATLPVVDLGCGRGEFLGLLEAEGTPCYGVDRHPDMATTTRLKGFEIVDADALEHLAAVERGSLGGIFCAQMIEHLPTTEVPRFFELAADALAPGAALAVETINPKSLLVFAHAFYVDLGHTRPLHPLTLEFLAEAAGFESVTVEYLSPPPPEFRPQPLPAADEEPLAGLVNQVDENFRRIDDLLFGPQDFAVVARR
ncbi:MAG: class I SAM-dependent methyltransferase, partial [Acidimicrobiales bacterium]